MFTTLRMSRGTLARTIPSDRWTVGLASIGLAIIPSLVQAQQAPATSDGEERQGSLDTIVVTGSAIGGVRKLEASYNIVTATEEQIRQSNPKSTADLLKISPGMWPESTFQVRYLW